MNHYPDIQGIILAAGASVRMGRPKWEVKIGGATFLDNIIKAFRSAGIAKIYTVFREIPDHPTDKFIPLLNPHPELGQLSSLKIALSEIDRTQSFLMHLVDRPLIEPETIRAMIDAFEGSAIIIPSFQGRKGHPVLFPPGIRDVLLKTDNNAGIRGGIRAWRGEVKIIEVDDEGILLNVDTPEDLTAAGKHLKDR